MKNDAVNAGLLMDFYGEMLTEKQLETLQMYYNDDLSLAEISEHMGITRQGVRDAIVRGEGTLKELEDKLCLVQRYLKMNRTLDKISSAAAKITELNRKKYGSIEIDDLVVKINEFIEEFRGE